ncbi:hypothetical protein KP79_PYT03763 [Mizuhopecten yessoensis]|uniref:Uncharacterized protein n=1 Tax=Mizuhopecten yessoensis TaxID=6573 RepID=A0A210QBG9_MIZYE|nr:hypothetical protein KP79_PYT03763 [Mizuhopecten yessoensis]
MMFLLIIACLLGITYSSEDKLLFQETNTQEPPEQKEQHHDVIISPSNREVTDQTDYHNLKRDQEIQTQKTKTLIAGTVTLAAVLMLVVLALCLCFFSNPKINFPDGFTLPTYV